MRFCTAEVRGSNPLGSTPKNADLQEKPDLEMRIQTPSGTLVQQPQQDWAEHGRSAEAYDRLKSAFKLQNWMR
jgi:hypothetical protein